MKNLFSIFIILFLTNSYSGAQSWIVTTVPSQNSSNISEDANITITFNQTLNSMTIDNNSIRVFGSQSGLHQTNMSYDSLTKTVSINPNANFMVGENVNVILTSKIKNFAGDTLIPYSLGFNVKVNSGGNEFQVHQTITSPSTNHNMVGFDFNNDSNLDIVKINGSNNSVSVFKNNLDTFSLHQNINLGNSNPHWGAMGDYNNDGRSDLAVAHMLSGKITILSNTENGSLIVDSIYSVGGGPYKIISCDFNNDANLDLAVCLQYSHILEIYINDGFGNFYKSYSKFIGNRPLVLASGDFNNDGYNDLALTKFDTKDLLILTNNKNNTFLRTDSIRLDDNPAGIISKDFDNDSYLDLAVLGWYSTIFILKNNLLGSFNISQSISNPSGGYMIDAADFDNDGDLDILANPSIGDSIRIYFNTGLGNFYIYRNYSSNQSPGHTDIIGDFDDDGDLDIAIGSYNNGTITVLKNSGVIPVELSEINISSVSNTVNITWRTVTETNNKGFSIYRDENFVSFISGNGTSTEEKSYSFSEANVPSGKHYYKVTQHDYDGSSKEIANLEVFVGGIADSYDLLQNYPNPFNPSTTIRYAILEPVKVTIKVYDLLGNEVAMLLRKEQEAGYHEVEFNAAHLASGTYIYQIVAGDFVQSKKMILIK